MSRTGRMIIAALLVASVGACAKAPTEQAALAAPDGVGLRLISIEVRPSSAAAVQRAVTATLHELQVSAKADALAIEENRHSGPDDAALKTYGPSRYRVTEIDVDVPRTLVVSKHDILLPRGDIVWREDHDGDTYDNVRSIIETGLADGVRDLNGPIPVTLDVDVRKFHALTEKARLTTGGVHAVAFELTVRLDGTGEALIGPKTMKIDLPAYGGVEAAAAVARGFTQRVRIALHVADAIRQELTLEHGYRRPRLGPLQILNYL